MHGATSEGEGLEERDRGTRPGGMGGQNPQGKEAALHYRLQMAAFTRTGADEVAREEGTWNSGDDGCFAVSEGR